MLKFLLIIVISIYVLSKVSRFFFGMGMSAQNRSYQKNPRNVNDDHAKSKNKSTVKGGEYIDYEEVK